MVKALSCGHPPRVIGRKATITWTAPELHVFHAKRKSSLSGLATVGSIVVGDARCFLFAPK